MWGQSRFSRGEELEQHLDSLAWVQEDAASRDGVWLGWTGHFLLCNPVCEFGWVGDLLQLVLRESWVTPLQSASLSKQLSIGVGDHHFVVLVCSRGVDDGNWRQEGQLTRDHMEDVAVSVSS